MEDIEWIVCVLSEYREIIAGERVFVLIHRVSIANDIYLLWTNFLF